ncbi:MAG: DivIVA domain-containing protein [Desulfobacterales bacterium]|nr:DivIVA domain-containing protein [Desulfobacterales bacterium]
MSKKNVALDIKKHDFKKELFGYNRKEVNFFLNNVEKLVENITGENEHLKDAIAKFKVEINGYKSREDTFKNALLNSQKVIEQMKENAHKAAELIIAEAEVNAEKILNNAHNRLSQLHGDITELKRQRTQIEVQIRSIIESHTKLLDLASEDAKMQVSSESNLKVFKKA